MNVRRPEFVLQVFFMNRSTFAQRGTCQPIGNGTRLTPETASEHLPFTGITLPVSEDSEMIIAFRSLAEYPKIHDSRMDQPLFHQRPHVLAVHLSDRLD
jgi:hypothetical protein